MKDELLLTSLATALVLSAVLPWSQICAPSLFACWFILHLIFDFFSWPSTEISMNIPDLPVYLLISPTFLLPLSAFPRCPLFSY